MSRVVRKILIAGGLLCMGFIGGCGGTSAFPVQTQVIPYTPQQQSIRESASAARYHLRDGDILKISFKYESDLNQKNVLILPDGYISPEGLGETVRAAGQTIDDLNLILTNEYGKDYRNPDLSVVIQEIASPQVYVMGMVKLPGLYKMPSNGGGVIQAIAVAGGFLQDAERSNVVVMRATEEGFLMRTLDLNHLEHVGLQDMSVFDLQAYDIIYVPRSGLGDFKYYADAIFGSSLNITRFFWDIYAIANIDKVQTIIR